MVYSMSLLIPWALSTLASIRSLETDGHGMFYVIITISAAWVADAGAYFVGSFLGKTKLCPMISPKKTVEGGRRRLGGQCAGHAGLWLGVCLDESRFAGQLLGPRHYRRRRVSDFYFGGI